MRRKTDISSAGLHVLAIGFMLCDHLWAALFPAQEWLTCIGRLAFPLFAFMAAEGCARTRDLRRYMLRMLCWAVLSEVPFNLMISGSAFYPYHQNVLWTFLLSLLLIALIEKCRARFKPVPAAVLSVGLAAVGFILGFAAMADYYGAGVLTVLTFYFFRGKNWKERLLQLVCLYILNVELLGGYCYELRLLGYTVEIAQQGLALLSLLPIWLYRGRQGLHSKAFQYFCYAFYPVHMLLLAAARAWILR